MIQLLDIASELAAIRPDLDAAIRRVLDSGVFIGGPEVAAFETELAAAVGARHAIGVSSGTDALLVTLMALGIGPGDEVVTTPFTFFATAGCIARLGARCVFADIDDTTLTLDPDAALAACTSRTKAILPVNLFGVPAALPTAPCPIVEDAAQSIGSGPVRGIAATLSFFPSKNLGAVGDAGAVLTDDPALADRINLLRTHGARPKYHHVAIGGNFRLDALQAAVLRVKLTQLQARTARRRELAIRYRALLAAAPLPPEVRLPPDDPAHVYHQFVIRVPRRDLLRAHLAAHDIPTQVYYPEGLHLQPCFADLGYRRGAFPTTETATQDVVAPVSPWSHGVRSRLVVEHTAGFYR
ncbi:MAG: DegT/DnrJ/EryC1/StrS family aminotransferase [Myxococcales bacterium]|nr:DegT/DnrJ/EryC1/StrS family aminotransferase [Myxococcales bacterium]